ncbi:uncharacterized protein LOC134276705 [Saccostrea cucullata]|uniref:uncharacterized protein LOC134276705 n=1 Tax=Saccostrea cuccullata TaxID=36930 RepID=UPI002ED305ED
MMKNPLFPWLGILSCLALTVESIIPPFMQRMQSEQPVVQRFRPTAERCCRVGERTARFSMSCSLRNSQFNSVHAARGFSRSGTILRNIDLLISKSTQCAFHFLQSFENCCLNKEQFLNESRLCRRRYTDKEVRNNCINIARSKYGQ